MPAHRFGKRRPVAVRDGQVGPVGVGRTRRVDPEHQHGTLDGRDVGCAAVNGERRARRDVAAFGVLAHRALGIAAVALLRREHAVLEVGLVVELRAERDLERAHFLDGVHAGEVEGQRVEPPLLASDLGHREVAVPRLVDRARLRDVEAELDDAVVGAEHRLAHRDHPRMGDQVDEPAQLLGVNFHVIAVRTAADRAAGPGQRLGERAVDVLAHRVGPLGRERAGTGGDAVTVEVGLGTFDDRRLGGERHAPILQRCMPRCKYYRMLLGMPNGPSLRDVAERAGVSIRTVSNVVNGFPLVAPHTRERVQRIIDELQYRPNAAARRLRGGRSGIVALVVPEIASPYFSEVAALIARGAEERSWTVLVEQTDGDAERERRLLGGIPNQFVDGLIVSPWALSPTELRREPGGAPLVLLGEQDADQLFDHVVIDNVAAAEAVTRHLIGLGRTRIAAVGLQPHLANGTAQLRLTGYRRALAEAGIPADPALEVPVWALHRADGAAAMQDLLHGGHSIDAVFCFTDQLALGALRVALRAGLRVPGDVAVAGFDDIEDGRYSSPSLTTVTPDKAAIAEHALACLDERMTAEGLSRPARRIIVDYQLSSAKAP